MSCSLLGKSKVVRGSSNHLQACGGGLLYELEGGTLALT